MATVLVVGATRWLGLEFARQYAADGARVIGTFRRPQDAEALRALGARALPLDALDPDSIGALGPQLDGQPGHQRLPVMEPVVMLARHRPLPPNRRVRKSLTD